MQQNVNFWILQVIIQFCVAFEEQQINWTHKLQVLHPYPIT